MTPVEIRYCPRCGEHIFKATQIKDGSVIVWCSQCEHTMRISDRGSDPLMAVFEEWAKWTKEASE